MPRTGENIYKRKDGRWEGRFIKEHINGKARYGYVYGKTRKETKKKLILTQIEWETHKNVIWTEQKDETLQKLANNWIECRKPFIKESSLRKYQNLLKLYIVPELGSFFVGEISNEKLCSFCQRLLTSGGVKGKGLSSKTVSDCIALIRNILRYAASNDISIKDISIGIPIKSQPKQLRVLSIHEQQKLCCYLSNNITHSNLGILLCLFTGIRVGELCALKWGDISLTDKTIYIHQTMQRLRTDSLEKTQKTKILISAPKSKCSMRIIPIPEVIMELITDFHCSEDAFFLTGEKSRFIEPRTMQNRFKKVLSACEIEYTNFHTLRHTFATRCVEVGFDYKSLSEILGHANVNITLNRYVHPTLELKRENMSKLSGLFAVK